MPWDAIKPEILEIAVGTVVGLALFWVVMRSAVHRGVRDAMRWQERRQAKRR